jgi:hypothetical protein
MKKIILLFLAATTSCFAADITQSQLDESKSERREKAFEDWIPVGESQIRFDELNEDGEFPIYSERKGGKVRDIFIDKPDGLYYWTWASMPKEELLKKHKQYTQEGLILVALSEHDNGYFWATWVNESNERKVLRQLKRFGITQASIEID